jgi:hypothetical protein
VIGFHEGTGSFVFTLRKVGADGKQLWSRTIRAPGCDTSGRVLGVAPGETIFIDLASGCDLPGFGAFAKGEGARFALDGTTALAGFATSSVSWAGHEVGGALGTPTLLTVDAAGQPRSARLPGGAIAVVTRGGCGHLWAYDASLQRLWERALDASCRTRTLGLSGVPASQLTGFGVYAGTADLGDGHTTTAPGPQDVFLGAFAP